MKNKKIFAGIIILIAIILAGQALEPTTQTQANQQYIEEYKNTTNLTNTTGTPEINTTNTIEIENKTPGTSQPLPDCTGSFGKLIKTNGNETYKLWELLNPADSIKIYSTPDSSTRAYQVYAAKRLIGPWLPVTEEASITTEYSTTAIYNLSGLYKYIKITANDTQGKDYLIITIEKCAGGGNEIEKEPIKYIDAVVPQGRGHGGCGCEDPYKHCTTTTTTTTSTSTTTTQETTTTKPTTTTTTSPTTTTTRHHCSTTTTQPTTSTTTQPTSTTTTTRHQCTTTKPTTTTTSKPKETTTTIKHCTTTSKPSTPTTTHQITTTTRHTCSTTGQITTDTIKHHRTRR